MLGVLATSSICRSPGHFLLIHDSELSHLATMAKDSTADSGQVCQGVNHPHSSCSELKSAQLTKPVSAAQQSLTFFRTNQIPLLKARRQRIKTCWFWVGWVSGRAANCEWPTVGSRRLSMPLELTWLWVCCTPQLLLLLSGVCTPWLDRCQSLFYFVFSQTKWLDYSLTVSSHDHWSWKLLPGHFISHNNN